MIYEINGKQADLTKALPLKLGDFEDLEGKGITQKDLSSLTFKQMRILVEHILQKANPTITTEDVRGMTLESMMGMQKLVNGINDNEKPNLPTSASSTSSQPSTAGGEAS